MWIGLLALLFGSIAGSTLVPVGTKIGVHYISPISFVFLRFFLAALLFSPFYVFSKEKKVLLRHDFKRLLFLSALLFTNVSLFSIGVQFTTVLMTQIIYTATPVVVGIFGHYFMHEKLTNKKITGMVIAIFGLLFLFYQSATKQAHLTFGTPLGNGIVLIAMLGYSGWVIYSRILSKKKLYSSSQTTFFTFIFIALYMVLFIPFEKYFSVSQTQFFNWQGIFISCFVAAGSIILYFFTQVGIKKTSAFTASLFQYFSPFLAGIVAIPLLHEKPTSSLFFGGILIIAGVFYATTYEQVKKYMVGMVK